MTRILSFDNPNIFRKVAVIKCYPISELRFVHSTCPTILVVHPGLHCRQVIWANNGLWNPMGHDIGLAAGSAQE